MHFSVHIPILIKTVREIKNQSCKQKGQADIGIDLAGTHLRPNQKPDRINFLPPSLNLPTPGKQSVGPFVLTSTQAQILDLMEGFAYSCDTVWARLLKVLKGQKMTGLQLYRGDTCRCCTGKLPEVPGDDRGYLPTMARIASASPEAMTVVLLL